MLIDVSTDEILDLAITPFLICHHMIKDFHEGLIAAGDIISERNIFLIFKSELHLETEGVRVERNHFMNLFRV